MDNHQSRGLWQGGAWERPSPVPPGPPTDYLPAWSRNRPVLRVRRRRRRWPWVAGILSLVILALGGAALLKVSSLLTPPEDYMSPGPGLEWPLPDETQSSDQPPSIPQAETGVDLELTLLPADGQPLTYSQVYERNIASLASLSAITETGGSTGSGVVLSQDGYILTNAHVVAGAIQVEVRLWDNRSYSASLVGFDAQEDLALLKIPAEGLTPAQFGRSDDLHCGNPVSALGDSLGYSGTFTDGIVSALDREVDVDGSTMILIQTSAAINFGNSGGPLLNQYGQVVGITTVKIVADDGSAESLGFAIPSTRVKYVVDRLAAGEEVRTGVFGFTVNTVSVEGGGLELVEVLPESDAYGKGLRPGDVITAVNGVPVTGFQQLVRIKLGAGPGDLVSITYRRGTVSQTVDVALIDAEITGG